LPSVFGLAFGPLATKADGGPLVAIGVAVKERVPCAAMTECHSHRSGERGIM
jgi:hypothetical protein